MSRRPLTRRAAAVAAKHATAPVPAVIGGVREMSLADYWAKPESDRRWGVLEVDTGVTPGRFYGRSVLWGFTSALEAGTIAGLGNVSYRADDAHRGESRQFVAFSRPPCTVAVAVRGGQTLQLAVPAEFPVLHQPMAWINIHMLANEKLLDLAKNPRIDKQVLRHGRARLLELNTTLPADMFTNTPTGCFLTPEGLQHRNAAAAAAAPSAPADIFEFDEEDDGDDDDDNDDEAEAEKKAEESDDDAMDVDSPPPPNAAETADFDD